MCEKIDHDHTFNRSKDRVLKIESSESSDLETTEAIQEEHKQTVGIILFDLGNPSSENEMESFLIEVFNDVNLISSLSPYFWAEKYLLKLQPYVAPYLSRYFVKKLSPYYSGFEWGQLQENIQEQARELEDYLLSNNYEVKVIPTMRYGTPSIEDALTLVEALGISKLVLLPVTPQFSWLTTGTFLQAFDLALDERELRDEILIRSIPHFYNNEFYIMALSQEIDQALEQSFDEQIRYQIPLLFVARGIPEKLIREHDPYAHHLEQSIELFQDHLGIPNPVYLTYQGNVKPMQWIGPQAIAMMDYLTDKDVPGILVIPLGWSCEQIETQILKQAMVSYAQQKGIQPLFFVNTLNNNKFFISALKQAIINDLHVIKNTSLTEI